MIPILTIDGPSGSGKGTVSRRVAHTLGWHLLDSGALYRIVALAGQLAGVAPDDAEGHGRLAAGMEVRFGSLPDGSEQIQMGPERRDVTGMIRSEAAGQGASRVAVWPQVRSALLERQRGFAKPPGLVADGRDMGTVVFPQAELKIYLDASAEERARRRYNQLKDKDSGASLAALSREIAARDQRDSTRAVAPLVPAADALVLDTTLLNADQVLARVLDEVRRRGLSAAK